MTSLHFLEDFPVHAKHLKETEVLVRSLHPAFGDSVINKNTKCPIDAHCHRHCRRDPRITKDCIELLQVLRFWVFFDFGKKKAEKFLAKVTSFFSSFRFSSSPSVDHLASEQKEMSLANRFKNFYRGQLFNFCFRRFFPLKISLLEMLIAVGNEHLKKS